MLEVSQLSAGYNGNRVIALQALSVKSGEHLLILGPSGSGKTTLLYALAGLLAPDSGTIRLNSTDMTALAPRARDAFRGRHIGIVFQTLHMVPALSVLDNLLLPAYACGLKQDRKAAMQWLERLGIAHLAGNLPETLSQGQRQRAALARALVHKPALLLCDEPTSALDDAACAGALQLLLEVAAEASISLVVATHDGRIAGAFTHKLQLEARP